MESLTRPPFHHRRKLSTISSSGLSYSGKEGHEDLFLVGNNKTKLRRAVSVEDYGEIFGGGGASVSSIKVLDLSDFDGPNGSGELRNSNVPVDYSRIFGGSAGDDGPVARPVPPYEELFDGAYKSNNDKAKQRVTADKESPLKGSDNVKDSYHGEMPEASNQDFDGAKKLNMSYHKTSPHDKNGSNGTKHVAQLNAVPGFAFFVNGDAGMQKQDIDKAIPRAQHVKAPPIDQSHPKGNLFYSGELDKSGPSKVSPASSSRARLNIDKMHLNQSESSSLSFKVDSPEKGADDGDLPKTTSDEELDVNSAASVSATALKKAIQEAQESIRIAKEIMEKKQDSMKMHSRCLLKVPDVIETKHVQHITSVSENNMKDACDVVDKDALLVNSKIDSLNQKENVEADGGMSSWFTHMLHNGKNRMAAFASQLVDKKTDSILPENCNQLQDAKTAKPEIETSEKNNPEKAITVDRRDVVSELKTFDTATYFSTNVISVPGMLVKDSNLMTQVDEECLQTRLDQGTTNKNGHEAKDCGHESAAEIIENEDIDVTTEHKEDGFAEGKIVEEDKEISETNALSKYANENHLNGSIDSCDTRDSDDISNGIPSQDFELCGLEVKNSLMDNNLAGHEKKACQLEVLKTEANNDLVVEENENENENENEVEDEIEEASRLKESEVCETSYYLNRSNEEDNLQGANSEGHRDLECEEDRKQVESELDRSNEERDVLEIIDGKNETNDNLECAVDEKEVEEDDERSYLDQNNVQGDDMETVVEDIFEAPLASDSKTDTIHEEIMLGEQPSDVDQVETSAFIYIGTEEHGIKNDMNDNPPPSEEYPPTFCLIDKNDSEKNVDSLNFVLGPENTIGMVHECSTEEVDTSKREGKKDNHVEDHQEKDRVEENMETKSDMTNIYEEIDSVLKTGQGMECSEENLNRSETVSVEIGEAKQKETDNDNYHKNILAIKREKERQKDKISVESAMREARERAFVEARERAERVAVDKANAEARQRASESWEKLEKASSQANLSTDKTSVEAAKLKAERAAVGRATEEARERALEKAMAQKSGTEARHSGSKNTGMKHSVSSPDLGSLEESNNESAQRRKARLERHERIMERAAKALAEKNMRDILAQREQSERNRIAETLNAEIKRWSSGKEGNLRALLSTLQYILGVNSGWQPITLTEIITTSAVKKAYKKATLYVHPDKLQQKGASIQHKYICEKVFDLLQAARNKFNSEER